jgi:hypothetical protein
MSLTWGNLKRAMPRSYTLHDGQSTQSRRRRVEADETGAPIFHWLTSVACEKKRKKPCQDPVFRTPEGLLKVLVLLKEECVVQNHLGSGNPQVQDLKGWGKG